MSALDRQTARLSEYSRLWKRNWQLIWQSVPGWTGIWAFLLVVQGVLPGVSVYLTKLTIDSFVAARNDPSDEVLFNNTAVLFLLTGGSFVLAEFLRYANEFVKAAQAEHFSDFLKNLIHNKTADVDLEYYESPAYHDLMEQARGESQGKPLAILDNLGSVIQNSITLISFAAILLSYGWIIAVLLVIGTIPGLAISIRQNRIFHEWWQRTARDRRYLNYFDAILSHSDAAAEVRLFNLGDRYREKFQNLRKRVRSEKLDWTKRNVSGKAIASTIAFASGGVAVGWIALRALYGLATLGDLAVFYQVFSRGQGVLGSVLGGVGQTFANTLYLKNLFAFLDIPPRASSSGEAVPFPERIEEGIHFKHVTFRYPGEDRLVLSDFSLFLPAGKIVAIVGVNGAGKSTLMKLACRFYDPEAGSIEIDGTDIRRFDLKELRRRISVLFQFPMRYQETVAENIAIGDCETGPEDARIEKAARLAGIGGFISKLSNGYETYLGKWFPGGSEISGGEWQKVSLARAYYRDAQIFILDEPTSFMDSWAEADWFDRFRELSSGRSAVLITHRFTIAMRADLIYVLAQGRVLEMGTHQELVMGDGLYATSWKAQMKYAGSDEPHVERAVLSSTPN